MKTGNGTANVGLALLAGASVAFLSVSNAQTPTSNTKAAAEELAEVTVTGSRVIANGNDSPTPMTVVTTEQMMAVQPSTLSDQVNLLPQLQGSQTQSTSGTGIRNGAAAYLTLRNAGDNHTLVLWDGHRVQPTTSQESHASDVDVNVIPQMLIQRVDIVTGGVSAVYGSDAVTGVVNFVTDTHFNGLKINGSTGISDYNDGSQANVGIAAGSNLFGGRGHFEGSYEYREDEGIFNRLARPIFANPPGYAGNGGTIPFTLTANIRTGNQSFVGLNTSGPLAGLQFAQNGVVSPFQHGTLTGVTNQEIGGDGAWNNLSSIKASLKFHQLFSRFDYDFTDNFHGYLQGAGTKLENSNVGTPSLLNLNIGYNNPFLNQVQQPYQAQLAAQRALTPNGSFGFTKSLQDIKQLIDTKTDYYMVVGGLGGSFGEYKWNLDLQHAGSKVRVRNTGNIDMSHLLAGANAVLNPANQQIVCNASLTNSAYSDCVPINLFGPTSASAAALSYVTGLTGSDSYSNFNDVTGSITGAPVSTWAGPVNMAVSGEWRSLDYHLSSFTTPDERVNCTGIQFSCTQGTTARWLNNTLSNRSQVSQTVGEVAYEADVPLVKDKSFVKAFNISGAARYTNYNTSGGVWTWKLGAEWHVNDDVTLRATRSRDIRAPNLNDLYNPDQPNRSSRFDLHTNTTATTDAVVASNPDLVPEDAATGTIGAVWQPHFLPRFSMSLDAYRIKIDNTIIVISATATQVQQACEASNGTSPLCDLFIRPFPFSNRTPANFPTQMRGQPLNIASIETYGADFEANYAADMFARPLSLRLVVAWQPHLIYDSGPSGVADVAGSAGGQIGYGNSSASPQVKLTFIGSYNVTDKFNVTVLERWRSTMRPNANESLIYIQNELPSIAYTNLNLSYKFRHDVGDTELFFNVQNLFDRYPSPSGLVTGDDPYGRYFTAGFRFQR